MNGSSIYARREDRMENDIRILSAQVKELERDRDILRARLANLETAEAARRRKKKLPAAKKS